METSHVGQLVNGALHYKHVIGGLVYIFFIGLVIWRFLQADAAYPGFLKVGKQKSTYSSKEAKEAWVKEGKDWLLEFAKKRRANGFQAITDSGPRIFFDCTQVNKLKNIEVLTLDGFVKKEFFPHIPGFDSSQVPIDHHLVVDAVKYRLTQNLKAMSAVLCDEADATIGDIFGNDTQNWKRFAIDKQPGTLVARLSSRALLGKIVCRNPAWVDIAVNFTYKFVEASRSLRWWPEPMRTTIHWVLPACIALRKARDEARSIIAVELKRRRDLGKEYVVNGGVGDLMTYMQEMAKPGEKVDWAGAHLAITVAAIHTTGDLMIKIIYYLCYYPEYQKEIRDEIVSIIREDGWEKLSLYKMKLLDSFMNEVQRIAPHSISSMNRAAEEEIKLEDGTVIPKGAAVSFIGDSYRDPKIYPDPEKFDGHRFLKLRSQRGQENHWQFVTTSPDHLGFGHGIHACPGRFFASNELKISLSFLLLRYEWKFDSPKEMPLTFWYGSVIVPNPMVNIVYKRRETVEVNDSIAPHD